MRARVYELSDVRCVAAAQRCPLADHGKRPPCKCAITAQWGILRRLTIYVSCRTQVSKR